MAAYVPPGPKRQKTKEQRSNEYLDYFQGIERVNYKQAGVTSGNLHYAHYNPLERLHGRTIEEWLKLSVSLTAFNFNGAEKYGTSTFKRSWQGDSNNTAESCKRSIKACFDFCQLLGLKYWTAYDSDLVPQCDNFEEYKKNFDEIAEFISEMSQKTHVKPLWIAPDLHSHPRYASGAATSNDATTFIRAAAQIKTCLDISQRINTECFVICPRRESYDNLFTSDVHKELKLLYKLLKMTAEYRDSISYMGQLVILPFGRKYCTKHFPSEYIWDVTSCLYFLRHFNLERCYKVFATPGRQMCLASLYNNFGGVVISDDHDNMTLAVMMKSIFDQGTPAIGGTNLYVCPRRDSVDRTDLVSVYVRHIDALARALRAASTIIAEQTFSKHVQKRYASYYSGWGARLLSGDVTMEECDEHAKKVQNQQTEVVNSPKSDYWSLVLQRYFDGGNQL